MPPMAHSFPDLRDEPLRYRRAHLSRTSASGRHSAVEEARSPEMAKTRRFSYFVANAVLKPRILTWSFVASKGAIPPYG